MSFNYSQLKIGDIVEVVVEVVRDPTTGKIMMHDTHPGNVVKVYGDSADIILTSASLGRLLLEWCVHVEDDRCAEIGPMELRIKESRDDLSGTPGSGIFRLSRNQKLLVGLEDRLAAQQQLLDSLLVRVATLEGAAPDKPRAKRAGKKSAEPGPKGELEPEPALTSP